jgi:hypothetical protein
LATVGHSPCVAGAERKTTGTGSERRALSGSAPQRGDLNSEERGGSKCGNRTQGFYLKIWSITSAPRVNAGTI